MRQVVGLVWGGKSTNRCGGPGLHTTCRLGSELELEGRELAKWWHITVEGLFSSILPTTTPSPRQADKEPAHLSKYIRTTIQPASRFLLQAESHMDTGKRGHGEGREKRAIKPTRTCMYVLCVLCLLPPPQASESKSMGGPSPSIHPIPLCARATG